MIETIIAIVREAGNIMLRANNIKDKIENKQGMANFVTAYDVEVQNYLFKELKAIYPETSFVGEEDTAKDNKSSDTCFIIDPIDGTTNFIFDYRHSAISVAFCKNGRIEAAVVYNPYLNEIFSAERGKGAYLNGHRIEAANRSLADGIVCVGTSPYYREKADQTFALTRALFDRSLDIRRTGSAALDLCYVAAGRFVLFFELLLSPWDYAAASLIITEAGGMIRTMDGREIAFDAPCSIIAATPAAYDEYVYMNI